MGYHLVGEVLDRAPDMPYRQLRVLLALALDARDSTRLAMPGHELLALRGNCSMRTVGRAVDGLAARGLVKVVGSPGPNKHRTVYAILPMPGTPDNMVADVTPDSMVADVKEPERRPSADQRRPFRRPTSDTTVADPQSCTSVIDLTAAPPPPPATATATAQTILAEFIDWDRAHGGQLTQRTKGQLARTIGGLLAEGIAEQHIRRGLADWRSRGQHPSTLHSFVDAAMNGHPARSRREDERAALGEREMARARARDERRAGRGELP